MKIKILLFLFAMTYSVLSSAETKNRLYFCSAPTPDRTVYSAWLLLSGDFTTPVTAKQSLGVPNPAVNFIHEKDWTGATLKESGLFPAMTGPVLKVDGSIVGGFTAKFETDTGAKKVVYEFNIKEDLSGVVRAISMALGTKDQEYKIICQYY